MLYLKVVIASGKVRRSCLADVHVGVGVRSRSRVICIIIGFGTGSNPSCSHEALARGPTSFLVVQLSPRGDKSLRGGQSEIESTRRICSAATGRSAAPPAEN